MILEGNSFRIDSGILTARIYISGKDEFTVETLTFGNGGGRFLFKVDSSGCKVAKRLVFKENSFLLASLSEVILKKAKKGKITRSPFNNGKFQFYANCFVFEDTATIMVEAKRHNSANNYERVFSLKIKDGRIEVPDLFNFSKEVVEFESMIKEKV